MLDILGVMVSPSECPVNLIPVICLRVLVFTPSSALVWATPRDVLEGAAGETRLLGGICYTLSRLQDNDQKRVPCQINMTSDAYCTTHSFHWPPASGPGINFSCP